MPRVVQSIGVVTIAIALLFAALAVSRAEMAVFVLRGRHGPRYQPPAVNGTRFEDVGSGHPFARWIDELALEGLTAGCGADPPRYCPGAVVDRGQLAVLLLRAKHGTGFQPPMASGLFADVDPRSSLCAMDRAARAGGHHRRLRHRATQVLPRRAGDSRPDGGVPAPRVRPARRPSGGPSPSRRSWRLTRAP
jgi:hypothetical protein